MLTLSKLYFCLSALWHISDVDECASRTDFCSQICINLNGTYSCSCRKGFVLNDMLSGVCRVLDNKVSFHISIVYIRTTKHSCKINFELFFS